MPQPPNLQKMLAEAQAMLAAQQEAQEKLKEQKVEASAGGGMVKVAMTGDLRLESLMIDPDAVDPEDVEMLQDMVVAAINEALRMAEELQQSQLGGAEQGGFDPMSALESLGLGGMGGLGGGGGGLPGGCRPAPAAATARRAARTRSASACSPRPSSGSSPSCRSCRGSATAPRSGSRSTCCARPTATRARWRRRSSTSRRRSRSARSASTSPRARAARSASTSAAT